MTMTKTNNLNELKSLINEFWYIHWIKKNLNEISINQGIEAAQKELYNYYSKETASYREFKEFTLDQIHRAFKELLGGIL